MATMNIVRQPDEFKFGEDFDLFFDRFKAYLTNVKCEKKAQFDLFLSFLDPISFRKCQAITFEADHRTEDAIDLDKAAQILKDALSKQVQVPPNIAVRCRTQKTDESISDFGYNIQILGHKAFGAEAETNARVIEAFCMGLSDYDLTVKMLQKSFTTLKAAIDYARTKESSLVLRKFVFNSRNSSGSSHRNVDVLECITEGINNVDISTHLMRPSVDTNTNKYKKRSKHVKSGQQYQHHHSGNNRAHPQTTDDTRDHQYYRDVNSRQGPDIPQNTDHFEQQYFRGHSSGDRGTGYNTRGSNSNHQGNPNWRGGGARKYVETRSCHYCGIKGHLYRRCYKRQRDAQSNPSNAGYDGAYYSEDRGYNSRDFRDGPAQ